jgi:hypothetical protein
MRRGGDILGFGSNLSFGRLEMSLDINFEGSEQMDLLLVGGRSTCLSTMHTPIIARHFEVFCEVEMQTDSELRSITQLEVECSQPAELPQPLLIDQTEEDLYTVSECNIEHNDSDLDMNKDFPVEPVAIPFAEEGDVHHMQEVVLPTQTELGKLSLICLLREPSSESQSESTL